MRTRLRWFTGLRNPDARGGLGLGEPIQALRNGIRDSGQDRGDDLVFPPRYRPGQGQQLGDVIVAGAPVVEGEEPAADVALARDRAGDAGAQVQDVAEFLLADPGRGDLLPARITRRNSATS